MHVQVGEVQVPLLFWRDSLVPHIGAAPHYRFCLDFSDAHRYKVIEIDEAGEETPMDYLSVIVNTVFLIESEDEVRSSLVRIPMGWAW